MGWGCNKTLVKLKLYDTLSMNTRNLLVVVLVAALTAAGVWFLKPAPAPEPVKTAAAPKPVEPAPAAPQPTVAPQVAAPAAAPAPAAETPAPAQTGASSTANGDAIVELNTEIGDMSSLLQAGDMSTLIDKYMPPQMKAQMTPEMMAQMQQQMQSPQAQQQLQMMAQALQSLQGQTPTFNDAGDRATYQMSPPAGMVPPGANAPQTVPVIFMKVDGHWYPAQGM